MSGPQGGSPAWDETAISSETKAAKYARSAAGWVLLRYQVSTSEETSSGESTAAEATWGDVAVRPEVRGRAEVSAEETSFQARHTWWSGAMGGEEGWGLDEGDCSKRPE